MAEEGVFGPLVLWWGKGGDSETPKALGGVREGGGDWERAKPKLTRDIPARSKGGGVGIA